MPNQTGNWTSGLGSLGNIGGGIMGLMNYRNPADYASPYLNQIPGMMQQYYSPYMNRGMQVMPQLHGQYTDMLGKLPGLEGQYGAMQNLYPQLESMYKSQAGMLPELQKQYGNLVNDPTGIMSKIGGTFQSSPGYKFQTGQAMDAANAAAAAGGNLGTSATQQGIANTVNQMANQDYYNYMGHGLGLYGQGLSGMQGLQTAGQQGLSGLHAAGLAGNQGLYGMGLQGLQGIGERGYGASTDMAKMLASNMMNQANLGYVGRENQNQSNQANWKDIFGGLGGLLFGR